MKYIFMNKNVAILECEIDGEGNLYNILNEYDLNYLPFGILRKDKSLKSSIYKWMKNRIIPASRKNFYYIIDKLNISDTMELPVNSLWLSLSDQYWFKPENSPIEWKDVNFFENEFSEDVGKVLVGGVVDEPSLISPDNTSDGYLAKKWIIRDDKRVLLKSGEKPYYQEPYNEVVASKISELLDINAVKYEILIEHEKVYSACENMINTDEELVPAYYLINSKNKPNDTSFYEYYVSLCENYGIKNARNELEDMIVLDYIMLNEDRHQRNYGVIRNVNTLKFERLAPIFDTGFSLFYNTDTNDINDKGFSIRPKGFTSTFEKSIELVKSWDRYDFNKLNYIDEFMEEIFSNFSNERKNKLMSVVKNRIKDLKLQREKRVKNKGMEL